MLAFDNSEKPKRVLTINNTKYYLTKQTEYEQSDVVGMCCGCELLDYCDNGDDDDFNCHIDTNHVYKTNKKKDRRQKLKKIFNGE